MGPSIETLFGARSSEDDGSSEICSAQCMVMMISESLGT